MLVLLEVRAEASVNPGWGSWPEPLAEAAQGQRWGSGARLASR